MTGTLLLRKLYLYPTRYITASEIKTFCRNLGKEYYATIRYLTYHGYLVRLLRGIFYIRSIEERKLRTTNINYLDAVREALRLKGVKHWYFGLETALKLNNVTHEYFAIDYVISDTLFRAAPVTVLGHKVRFVKLTPALVSFGLVKGAWPYSDKEKTLLDFIYLARYSRRHVPWELLEHCSKKKLFHYAKSYPTSVQKIVERAGA